MSTPRALTVYVAGKPVGALTYEDYQYSFSYEAPTQLDPTTDMVSLTMPVRARSYDTQILPPPFQSVLPEGDLLIQLRARFGKALNLDEDFNLLRLVGHNTIGRLTFSELGDKPRAQSKASLDLDAVLRHPDATELLNELIDRYGLYSGIGGIQPKALLPAQSGPQLTITHDSTIIKAAGYDYPKLPMNEYFCLQASQAAGIPTVSFRLSKTRELLVVDRFDRTPEDRPLAFEEACALLRLGRQGKYTGSYEQIAEVIQQIPCRQTPTALESFFRTVALSMVIRNGDAHLKNFGVVYHSSESVSFAPAYDLVTTTVYFSDDVPALELAGRKLWPDRETLEHFGLQACGLRRAAVRRSLEAVENALHETDAKLQRFGKAEPAYRELTRKMREQWGLGARSLRSGAK